MLLTDLFFGVSKARPRFVYVWFSASFTAFCGFKINMISLCVWTNINIFNEVFYPLFLSDSFPSSVQERRENGVLTLTENVRRHEDSLHLFIWHYCQCDWRSCVKKTHPFLFNAKRNNEWTLFPYSPLLRESEKRLCTFLSSPEKPYLLHIKNHDFYLIYLTIGLCRW